jgi:hypothetical protein
VTATLGDAEADQLQAGDRSLSDTADLSLACWIYPLVGAAPYNPETRFFRNGAMQFNALRSFIASSLHSAPALASLPPSALH